MSCRDFEQQIALYVGDDLSSSERDRTEAHLRECSSCRALAEDIRESQAIFKSMRQDIPDAAAFAQLRERVTGDVGRLGSMSWLERFLFGGLGRKAALAGLVLAIGGFATFRLTQPETASPRSLTVVESNTTPPRILSTRVYESQPPAAPPAPKRVRRSTPKTEVDASGDRAEQVPMKFLTDDPNIIIYWLVDEKGD